METFKSFANEEYTVALDASATGKLPAGASVSSATVEVMDLLTERIDNTLISSVNATVLGNVVSIERNGGIAGRKYLFKFAMTLSNGNSLLEGVIHRVKKFI